MKKKMQELGDRLIEQIKEYTIYEYKPKKIKKKEKEKG